jgi:peroxiredoxin
MFNKTLILLLLAIVFSCTKKQPAEETTVPTVKPVYNDLPTMPLTLTNSEQIAVRELPGNTILILFFPDCDHCQREAKAIQERLDAFKNYTIYFISSAPMDEIKKFAEEYKLNTSEKVKFGNAETAMVIRSFGAIPTPSLYIYSNDRRMVKKFEGETSVEEIIRSL